MRRQNVRYTESGSYFVRRFGLNSLRIPEFRDSRGWLWLLLNGRFYERTRQVAERCSFHVDPDYVSQIHTVNAPLLSAVSVNLFISPIGT